METDKAEDCRDAAAALLTETILPEFVEDLRQDTALGTPIPVRNLAGRLSHWIVPVEAAGRHVALIDVGLECQILRYEIRAHSRAETAGLGKALTEMTAADINRGVKTVQIDSIGSNESARMVSVGAQTRTAWASTVRAANGVTSTVFVTPEFSWLSSDETMQDT